MLLLSQKNELFDLIEQEELSPSQFKIEMTDSQSDAIAKIDKVSYVPYPDYMFLFDRRARHNVYFLLYSPGLHNFQDEAMPGTDWFMVKRHFQEWLSNLKRELGQIDRWKTMSLVLAKSQPGFEQVSTDQMPFSVPAYERICAQLDKASEKLEEMDLEEEQIEILRYRFEHLKDMGRTLSKSDWQSLFVGSMVGSLSQMGITAETAQAIWHMLRQIFGHLLIG